MDQIFLKENMSVDYPTIHTLVSCSIPNDTALMTPL